MDVMECVMDVMECIMCLFVYNLFKFSFLFPLPSEKYVPVGVEQITECFWVFFTELLVHKSSAYITFEIENENP